MAHRNPRNALGSFNSGNFLTLFNGARIAGACKYHGNGNFIRPANCLSIQCSRITGTHNLDKIAFKSGQDNLRFRISKPSIKLKHPRAVFCQHKAAIQATGIWNSLGSKLCDNALLDCNHIGVFFVRNMWAGRKNAHATGIGAGITIKRTLMILSGGKRN